MVSKALTEASGKMDIRISFDSGAMDKFEISGVISGNSPEEILTKILRNTGYKPELKHNTYLVVKEPEKPKFFQVQGVVYDRETGENLPYATVMVSGQSPALSTSVNGTFGFQAADSSGVFVRIRYLGYSTLDTLLQIKSSGNIFLLGLEKKLQALQTVEVAGEKLQLISKNDEAGHFEFNPNRFDDLPNYGETDVFRALQLLPGISLSENSSQLNIRGSSADQNLVLFDGFTLYNLDHFFGVFSALNPYVIKNVQVYRGGFDSRYGERVSGIVDITSKTGNQLKPEIYGGINLISANLTAEIPVSKKLTFVAAVRRAYTDIYSSWLADALLASKNPTPGPRSPEPDANTVEPDFYFSDFNFKTTYEISPKENISLSVYGAKDYLNSSSVSGRQNFELNTEDINEWGNYGLGASWKKQWNTKSFTNLQTGHSGYYNDYFNNTTIIGDAENLPMPQPPQNADFAVNETNRLSDYFVSFQNKYQLNQQHLFEWGAGIKYNHFEFYKDANPDVVYNNLKNTALLSSVFFQNRISVGKQVSVKPGFRVNYYNNTGRFYVEPRLTATLKSGEHLVWKTAVGKYYQYLNKTSSEQTFGYNRDFWVLADGDQLPVLSSNHFIAGAGYETKHFYFDLEAYYKTMNGLQEYLFFQNPKARQPRNEQGTQPESPLSQFIAGTGKAYGVDFLAKYENTGFTSWLAYSLSKSIRNFTEINNNESIPASFDKTHELKWTTIYSYKKWSFSTLTLYTTGHPYIESATKADDFSTMRVYNRLPDYFRLDFSANYSFTFKKILINPGFSLLNALNTENYLDIYIRNFDIQNQQVTETNLVKAQDLTLNFFLNFRF